MTTQWLISDIRRDEGYSERAYPDPLSGGEPWTCGYGCTGPDVGPLTVWTEEEADERMRDKLIAAECDLDRNIPWWRTLPAERQDVLANMCFNLGWPRLSKFEHALAAMKRGDWAMASAQMLLSRWATQVGPRATRLAAQMRTGVRQAR